MDEFALIRKYFASLTPARAGVVLGIGDDCALLQPPPGRELAVTTDTLVAGRHFPEAAAAADIGWKSLAVNLSDLAAMGAEPFTFTLALTLPKSDERWLQEFGAGLGECAHEYGIALVGGDTTRGPLSVTITAMGLVEPDRALRRAGARPGDIVCVTGTLGDAALALKLSAQAEMPLLRRLNRPTPRLGAGLALRGLAHAAIDLSDGLAGDLAHVCAASNVGAEIDVAQLPTSATFERLAPSSARLALQVSGGDDYELCICIPAERVGEARAKLDIPLTPIGRMTPGRELRFLDAAGRAVDVPSAYRHFP